MNTTKKSLLRYPGGKTRAVKILKGYIPETTKEVTSLFFGGGSFEFYLTSQGVKINAYDNFDLLVTFWQEVKHNKEKLVSEVLKHFPQLQKVDFYKMQKDITSEKDPLKIASMFYVLNRCSFSGAGLSGGMSPNHERFTANQIEELRNFKTDILVERKSFEDSIDLHEGLIFADPPYLIDQKLYGVKGDMHSGFNHALLAKKLKARGNFILTYNDSDEVRNLYSGCSIVETSWAYGMNKTRKSSELIITP